MQSEQRHRPEKVASIVHGLSTLPEADICVIGTGPAAYALLAGLQRRSSQRSILFLEGATGACPPLVLPNVGSYALPGSRRSREYITDTQDLNEGGLTGWIAAAKPGYLRESRVRAVGGTGTAWTGWLCPFLPDHRAARAFQAWPLKYQELVPHYRLILETLGLPSDLLNAEALRARAGLPKWPEHRLRKDGWRSAFALLAPFDFRRAFLQALDTDRKARLLFATNAIHLETTAFASRRQVTKCLVRNTRAGTGCWEMSVRARVYVIAAGTLETTRLLLASGLGEQLPALGKYFVEHPYLWNGGRIVTASRSADLAPYLSPSLLQLTSRIGILHFLTRLPEADDGRLPIRFATNGLGQQPGTLNISWETTAANASLSLVENQTDRLGMPKLQLNSGEPQDTLQTGRLSAAVDDYVRLIADLFGKHGTRLALFAEPVTDWKAPYRVTPGNHPAGTCRMAPTEVEGVVDNQCRVHGFDNLYIASSAVFPTSGYANPTLTVMALADRLAQWLSAGLD